MKVGILSDIHGNSYALEAVLASARKMEVEKILVLGDNVGYYYHPDRVLDLMDGWDWYFIRGNHERLLQESMTSDATRQFVQQKYGSGHETALNILSAEQLRRLTEAPDSMNLTLDNVSIKMSHGTPWDPDEYLYPNTERRVLEKISDSSVNYVFVGHSHYQFIFSGSPTVLVNPGSIGQNRKRGGYADWAILNTSNSVLEFMSTPYSTSALLKEVSQTDPGNAYLQEVLKRGCE